MWMGKRLARDAGGAEESGVGTVSVGGDTPAVVTDAEQRQARLFSPGGYCWRPAADDEVLVIKTGEPCVAGRAQNCPVSLAAGEVYLYAAGASVQLKNNGDVAIRGTLRITGNVYVDGRLFVGGAEVKGESALGA